MPRLSCWFVRAALIHLGVGFTLGALLLANKGVPFFPALWRWRQTHIECLLLGWTVQLMLGIAFWILPRFQGGRGNETPAWAAFWFLNTGVVLVAVGSLFSGMPTGGWLILLGRLAETSAAATFALHAWSRVKPAGAW